MGYGIGKRDNEYARAIANIDAPKTVFMAIALSLAMRIEGSQTTDAASRLIMDEWQALHDNGIVPQKPRTHK